MLEWREKNISNNIAIQITVYGLLPTEAKVAKKC